MNACITQSRASLALKNPIGLSDRAKLDGEVTTKDPLLNDTQPKDFPPIIRTALSRAAGCDSPELQKLGVWGRALLVRLLRNVSAIDPREPVRVANSTLACALECSERTVQRLKATLEEAGWITRQQVQSRRAGMQISDITLTAMALRVLGLTSSPTSCRQMPSSSATPPSTQRPVSKPNEGAQPAHAKTLRGDTGVARLLDSCNLYQETRETLSERAEQGSKTQAANPSSDFPQDLKALEGRVTKPALYLLMGLARKQGYRLSQVVNAVKDTLEQAKAPVAYLKRVLAEPGRDWAVLEERAMAKRATAAQPPSSSAESEARTLADAASDDGCRMDFSQAMAAMSAAVQATGDGCLVLFEGRDKELWLRQRWGQFWAAKPALIKQRGEGAWGVVPPAMLQRLAQARQQGATDPVPCH